MYIDEASDASNVTNPEPFHSNTGHIKVEFMSDLIINEGKGFEAEFSIGELR